MSGVTVVIPEIKRTVTEYDFLFSSGVMMPVTIDVAAGDTLDDTDPLKTVVYKAAKTHPHDSDKSLPAETLTIFKQHLLCIQQRDRDIIEPSPEQKDAWQAAIRDAAGTVQ